MLADKMGHGWLDPSDMGILEGTDFYKYVENIRNNTENEKELKCGPTQEAFMNKCSTFGVKPKAHFGGQLNGNDALNFVKAEFSELWAEHVSQNTWLSEKIRTELQSRLSTLKVASDAYLSFFEKISSTSPVSDLDDIDRDIGLFMFAYRRAFKTTPPKVGQ